MFMFCEKLIANMITNTLGNRILHVEIFQENPLLNHVLLVRISFLDKIVSHETTILLTKSMETLETKSKLATSGHSLNDRCRVQRTIVSSTWLSVILDPHKI